MLNVDLMAEKSPIKTHLLKFQSFLYMEHVMWAMVEEESMAMRYGKQVLDL